MADTNEALVVVEVKRTAALCFATFVDARHLTAWVPGLRRAKVVRTNESGLPLEVLFEFGAKRTYSLVYTYDFAQRRAEWRPGVGHRDAVRGWVVFEENGPTTCRMCYQLEPGVGQTLVATDRSDPRRVAEAFVKFVER